MGRRGSRRPNALSRWLALLAAAGLCSCGTVFSRFDRHPFGAYPFEAVALDGWLISRIAHGHVDMMGIQPAGVALALCGLVSLPIDLLVDTVALPVDLVVWATGTHKHSAPPVWPPPRPDEEPAGGERR